MLAGLYYYKELVTVGGGGVLCGRDSKHRSVVGKRLRWLATLVRHDACQQGLAQMAGVSRNEDLVDGVVESASLR